MEKIICPLCKGKDCNLYSNIFVCFSCKKRISLEHYYALNGIAYGFFVRASRLSVLKRLVVIRDNKCMECGLPFLEDVSYHKFLAGDSLIKCWKGFEVHHVIPVSEGGKDSLDNLVLLCKKCHIQKRSKQSIP